MRSRVAKVVPVCFLGMSLVCCADLQPQPGKLECEGHSDCPSGWFCAENLRCYPPGADAGPLPCDCGPDTRDCSEECDCETEIPSEGATETATGSGTTTSVGSDSNTEASTGTGTGTERVPGSDTAGPPPDGGRDTGDSDSGEDAGATDNPEDSGDDAGGDAGQDGGVGK